MPKVWNRCEELLAFHETKYYQGRPSTYARGFDGVDPPIESHVCERLSKHLRRVYCRIKLDKDLCKVDTISLFSSCFHCDALPRTNDTVLGVDMRVFVRVRMCIVHILCLSARVWIYHCICVHAPCLRFRSRLSRSVFAFTFVSVRICVQVCLPICVHVCSCSVVCVCRNVYVIVVLRICPCACACVVRVRMFKQLYVFGCWKIIQISTKVLFYNHVIFTWPFLKDM